MVEFPTSWLGFDAGCERIHKGEERPVQREGVYFTSLKGAKGQVPFDGTRHLRQSGLFFDGEQGTGVGGSGGLDRGLASRWKMALIAG